MTINAALAYLGGALTFTGAAFMVLAIRRPRSGSLQNVEACVEVLRNRAAVIARRRADAYCGAILLCVAVVAEVVSITRGGPASGQPSGNTPGASLAISVATFVCLIGCLVARHFILVHLRRSVEAQTGRRSE
jgi:hypothetical protein